MSLIKKIEADRDAELLGKSEVRLGEERNRNERKSRLAVMVSGALQTVSLTLEEEFEPLGEGIDLPRYYRIGDVVLAVQLFTASRDELPDPDCPHLALVEYYAALVGVDRRSGSLENFRIGTLKWLNYQGFYKALTTAPSYLRFDADTVLGALRFHGIAPES